MHVRRGVEVENGRLFWRCSRWVLKLLKSPCFDHYRIDRQRCRGADNWEDEIYLLKHDKIGDKVDRQETTRHVQIRGDSKQDKSRVHWLVLIYCSNSDSPSYCLSKRHYESNLDPSTQASSKESKAPVGWTHPIQSQLSQSSYPRLTEKTETGESSDEKRL